VLVISTPLNLKYLTGFGGSSGLLVSSPRGHRFITDGRYDALVREWMREGRFASMDVDRVDVRYDLTLASCLVQLGVRRAGFEAGHVTVATLGRWQDATKEIEWRPTDNVIERQRLIKDEAELAIFRRAGKALSAVAAELRSWLAINKSEREVARAVDRAMERGGFERPAFDTIVASGPNSAYPHARATDRLLRPGDLVLLDFGGVLDGYCVDLTRMASIGAVGSAAARLCDAVHAAHQAAVGAIRAGTPGSDAIVPRVTCWKRTDWARHFFTGRPRPRPRGPRSSAPRARADSGAADVLGREWCAQSSQGDRRRAGRRQAGGRCARDTGRGQMLTDAPRSLLVV
jgi:Xaa-Pro aminopeptidase